VARQILSSVELSIEREDDVVLVRRKLRDLAQARGFDAFATAALTTAASELARNALVHGRGGRATLREVVEGARSGLYAEFRDEGPGIADLERALAGGYSTARSLGLGLSGARRLVDEFEIASAPGQGTTATITKWKRPY
jgi:serine/threonine-protein kinase RsbT